MNTLQRRVLGLDPGGRPYDWLSLEDAARYITIGRVMWSYGQDLITLHGGRNRFSGVQSTLEIPSVIAIDNVRSEKLYDKVPQLTNERLFRRDENICMYCGQDHSARKLSRDHIHPRSRGGEDVWENVVTACIPCNHKKNDRTPEEANMSLLALPYAPNHAEILILQNKNILADQMEIIRPHIPRARRA